jgi:hypothetical protein
VLAALRAWLARHPVATARWARRPLWLKAVFAFLLFMTFVFMPWDFLVKPFFRGLEGAEEVWFGFMLRGWAAKATEPLHWAIYAALAWGLWEGRKWALPAAALYFAQVAVGMLIWNLRDERGMGVLGGLASGIPFALLAVALWLEQRRFAA